MNDESNIPTQTLAESENFTIWVSEEPDGETVFHIDVGAVSLHLFEEEFLDLIKLLGNIQV